MRISFVHMLIYVLCYIAIAAYVSNYNGCMGKSLRNIFATFVVCIKVFYDHEIVVTYVFIVKKVFLAYC